MSDFVAKRLGFPIPDLLKFPKYFHIETIDMCNARCIMCGIDFDKKNSKTMSDDLFQKIVKEMIPWKEHIEKVMPYLDGEPLLDRDICNRIKLLKDSGIRLVNIATNGSLLSDRIITNLLDSGLDEIYVTIDSLDKTTYEAIRVGLKFEKVLNQTLRLIEMRNSSGSSLKIRVQMVRQESNYSEAEDFIKFWKSKLNNCDQVVIQNAHNWGNKVDVLKIGDEHIVNDKPCIALWGTFVAHMDGTVPLCCIDTESDHKIGNLNKNTIQEVWTNQLLLKYRELHENGNRSRIDMCNGCTLWREDKRSIAD